MFLSMSKNIKASRKRMKELMIKHESELSVEEVIHKMNKMLEGQTIIYSRNYISQND